MKKLLMSTALMTVLFSGAALSAAHEKGGIKVSGSIEYNYLAVDNDAGFDNPRTMGADIMLNFRGSGDLGAGGKYAISYAFKNGDQDFSQLDLGFGATTIELGQDNSAGIEDVKALLPYINNRFGDVTSNSGIDDVADNTSSTTSAAINQKLGKLGTFSIAYNPNIATNKTQETDRISTESRVTAVTTTNLGTGSSLSGSFRGSLGVDGLTVGLGYMEDNSSITANDDRESLTYGLSYNFGKAAVGYQRIENTLGTAVKASTIETEIDQYGVSFAASDELSFGIYQIKQEETTQGAANSPELKANLFQVGYKFGSARVSYDFLDVEKANNSAGDATTHKIKIGMAF